LNANLDGNVGLTKPEIYRRFGVLLVSLSIPFTSSLAPGQPKEPSQTGSAAALDVHQTNYFLSASFHLSSHGGCSTTQKPYYGVCAVKQITCTENKVLSVRYEEKGLQVGRSRGQ
jgi:hypothetical protein